MKTQAEYFQQLWALDAELERTEKGSLHSLGLQLRQPVEPGGYFCSPKNSRVFAYTGGDGVHFSFLLLPGIPVIEGPVVMTRPGFDKLNVIVGETLHEFLCLGCVCGHWLLEFLEEHLNVSLPVYQQIMEDISPGYEVDAEQRKRAEYLRDLLEIMCERMDLKPWTNVELRLAELQEQYLEQLVVEEEPESLVTKFLKKKL